MSRVLVYSTNSCPYCVALEEFLKEKGIVFEEINVSEDQQKQREMIEKSGQIGSPVVDIDGEIVVGFDKEGISKILKLKT
jgi:glutaredoxin-like YruB-family protein